MASYIAVKSGLRPNEDGSHKVALWERDDAHPKNSEGEHEVFVCGPNTVRVGMTALVRERLNNGMLVRAGKDSPADEEAAAEAEASPEEPAKDESDAGANAGAETTPSAAETTTANGGAGDGEKSPAPKTSAKK